MAQSKRVWRAPNLSTRVYEAIRDDIMSGSLKGGERIIVEHLADELGVSATPVREALVRLTQEGIIEEVPPGKLQVVRLTADYVLDTYQVRSVLEGLAAELAAPHLTDAMLATFADAVSAAGKALTLADFRAYAEADRQIHTTITSAAGNRVLVRELGALQSHIGYIRDYSYRHIGQQLRLAQSEHLPILDALQARDAARSRKLMELHIRNSGTRIAQIIIDEHHRGENPAN